jgi:hypothetical protein
MACNCGKNRAKKFIYTSAKGKRTEYATEVEAKAAKIKEAKASPSGITGSYVSVTR